MRERNGQKPGMTVEERLEQMEEFCVLHDRLIAAMGIRLIALEKALKDVGKAPPAPCVERRTGRATVIVLPPLPVEEAGEAMP